MKIAILIHGIFIPKIQMYKLKTKLEKENYQVFNIGYPSRKGNIESNIKIVKEQIINLGLDKTEKEVNLIGFSMGGLIIRELTNQIDFKNLKNIIMIGTPNKGSILADIFGKYKPIRLLFGPAIDDLKVSEVSKIKNIKNSKKYKIGIIAGKTKTIASFIFKEENDSKVAVKSTKLDQMNDFIILNFTHSLGPINKKVIKQVIYFLKHSNFKH